MSRTWMTWCGSALAVLALGGCGGSTARDGSGGNGAGGSGATGATGGSSGTGGGGTGGTGATGATAGNAGAGGSCLDYGCELGFCCQEGGDWQCSPEPCSSPECCKTNLDCPQPLDSSSSSGGSGGSGWGIANESVEGVCKAVPPIDKCWTNEDCGGGFCQGASNCPCGFDCAAVDKPGDCLYPGPEPFCCKQNSDCGDLWDQPCINGVCKMPVPDACWNDSECPAGQSCVGASACPCGASCAIEDAPGKCQ